MMPASKNSQDSSAKVIILGQIPPPHSGQAVMIERLLRGLSERMPVIHIPMQFSHSLDDIGRFAVRKVIHLFRLVRRTRRAVLTNRHAVLYYPPAPPRLIPLIRDIILLTAVRQLARKTVFHFEANGIAEYLEQHKWLRPLALLCYSRPDVSVILAANCRHDADYFHSKEVRVIPNGIDVGAEQVRRRTASSPVRILFVGAHCASKGIREVVSTAALLRRKDIAFTIHTMGKWASSQEKRFCTRLLKKCEVRQHVVFRGWMEGDAKWKEYAEADLFFFPSFYPLEAMSVATVEATAFGLPIVASRWRGNTTVVVDGKTGFLHDLHDVGGYTESLARLCLDPNLRSRFGRAARDHYERHFTEKRFVEAFEKLFRDLSRR